MPQTMSLSALLSVLPLLAGSVWTMLVLVVEMFSTSRRFTGVAWLSVIGLVGIAALALQPGASNVYVSALARDDYTTFFTVLTCAFGIGAILLSIDYLPAAGINKGEYYPLMLFAVLGVVVMAAATDLIVMADSAHSTFWRSACSGPRPTMAVRRSAAKPPAFTAVAMNAVTDVGAPS